MFLDSHIFYCFIIKLLLVVPIGNRDGGKGEKGREREKKKGRNDWRDKEGRGGRGEVYDLTNLSGEDTPLIFVYILASFMEILGKVEKLASSIFSREKLRARELS